MKIYFLFSLVTIAQAANLRSTKSVPSSPFLESEVILHGVTGQPSANDLDIIGHALVSSYNDVNWELGHYMTGFQSVAPESLKQSCGGTCSDDDSKNMNDGLFMSVVTPIKQSCGGTCSDDDRANSSILTKAIKQSCGGTCSDDDSATAKQTVLASFCQKIKSSGSAYLENTKDCSVVFVPIKEQNVKPAVAVSISAATMEAHVILQGVLEKASETDMAIIGKALVASYNDVNWDTGFHMSDVAVPFQAVMPQPHMGQSCGGTCSDDDRAAAITGSMGLFVTMVGPIQQSCGGTCRDDDATAAVLKQSCGGTCRDDDSVARSMLEASFCDKIKSSVSSNLAGANMCAIVLVAK